MLFCESYLFYQNIYINKQAFKKGEVDEKDA